MVVCLRWRLKGVFEEHLDLTYFPWDLQTLSLRLVANSPPRRRFVGIAGEVVIKNWSSWTEEQPSSIKKILATKLERAIARGLMDLPRNSVRIFVGDEGVTER